MRKLYFGRMGVWQEWLGYAPLRRKVRKQDVAHAAYEMPKGGWGGRSCATGMNRKTRRKGGRK